MALPTNAADAATYIRSSIDAFHCYDWLYKYPNTDIYANNVLGCLPQEWISFSRNLYAPLGNSNLSEILPQSGDVPNAPNSLNNFITQFNSLRIKYKILEKQTSNQEGLKMKHISYKKIHEVLMFAPLIEQICNEEIDYVIDIGCGLGYLTRVLKDKGLNIMGLDGNKKFVETARKRHPDIPFEYLYLSLNTSVEIEELLKKSFKEFDTDIHKVCVIGLHACGDLTVDMLHLLRDLKFVNIVATMPCCYHRMKTDCNGFINFPLSVDSNTHPSVEVLRCVPFLRLACQRRLIRSQAEKLIEVKNLMFRNLLQLVTSRENLQARRKHRKTGSNKIDYEIEDFLVDLENKYLIVYNNESTDNVSIDYDAIKESILHEYNETYKAKEAELALFIELQNFIQEICENLVLIDRCIYVNKWKDSNCITIKVADDSISPRCFALVASRNVELNQIRC